MQSQIIIFTDGASSGNPGPGGWGALVAYDKKVTELGGGEERSTNNRMELTAVLESLSFVIEQGVSNIPITLYTDSSYVANGATLWIKGWQNRNWTNQAGDSIANVDLWKKMNEVLKDVSVKIIRISGHSGIPGNERVDEIATGYIKENQNYLYHGPLDGYSVDILNTKVDEGAKKEKDRKKGKAYSYVSLIGKDFMVHYTWDECKKRVEGAKGAKYKKALSQEDEESIKKSWGIK
jgi:ribonuclease HI